jgi:hypothetical protein
MPSMGAGAGLAAPIVLLMGWLLQGKPSKLNVQSQASMNELEGQDVPATMQLCCAVQRSSVEQVVEEAVLGDPGHGQDKQVEEQWETRWQLRWAAVGVAIASGVTWNIGNACSIAATKQVRCRQRAARPACARHWMLSTYRMHLLRLAKHVLLRRFRVLGLGSWRRTLGVMFGIACAAEGADAGQLVQVRACACTDTHS